MTLSIEERARRKKVIEDLLQLGYHPQGRRGGIASATKTAERQEGINYPNWVRAEEALKRKRKENYAVNWSLYVPPAPKATVTSGGEELSAEDVDPLIRAKTLSAEVTELITRSKYPVINPEAVIVDTPMLRRWSTKHRRYEEKEGRPRTWMVETLKVAPIMDSRNRNFIFTGAQNDALLHEEFWANLQAYAAYIDAEIIVGPWTYETQWWSENDPQAREYAPELAEHLCFGQMKIGSNFVFCGEMNTLPTASQPISDLVTYSRGRWAVFPHAKRQLKSVPSSDPNVQAHQVMTSGACTRPKIIPRKAGVKSLFHQVVGATVVQFDDEGDIFCRQITADDDTGAFYDLDAYVANGEVTTGHRVDAMTCADIHVRKLDQANCMAVFGWDMRGGKAQYRNSMVDVLNPKNIIVHDVFDNEARNHHHIHDNAHSYEMAIRGRDSVESEVDQCADFFELAVGEDRKIIVAEGNHDLALEKYVREGRYRNDGTNIRYGIQLEDAYLGYVEARSHAIDNDLPVPRFSLLEYAIRTKRPELGDKVEWCHDGYSRLINGIEVGNHGFRGPNGARGTVAGFARAGRKMSIGDKHSPEIMEGVYVAGVMNLRHGYNKGLSGWAVTMTIQYPDGKRSLVTLQNGKWRPGRRVVRVQAPSLAA
ncbi:putative A1 protein [Bradyrhizobium phage BDU-MI-1]|nr:putative A1 protein [Bradyrhizobium phage BDU-MI-1]